MSSYIYNRVICHRDVFLKLFMDDKIFGPETENHFLSISFNKIWKRNSIYECPDQIHYECGITVRDLDFGKEDIRFVTLNLYPIETIIQLLGKHKKVVWYAAEENENYISRFYNESGHINEDVYPVDEKLYELWNKLNPSDEKNECETKLWEFIDKNELEWKRWNVDMDQLFEHYRFKYPLEEFCTEILDMNEPKKSVAHHVFTCKCGRVHDTERFKPDPYKYFVYDGVEMDLVAQDRSVIYPNDPEQKGQFWAYYCIECGRLNVFRYGEESPEFTFTKEE